MRLLSLLPILALLLAGSLRAQNQCSIYDLTATVTAFSNACEYYVVLDFQHSNTTTQFQVKGNGNNYGTFNYDQLPLKLGPFTAGAAASVKEFVVVDIEYGDCQDAAEVQIPGCNSNSGCDIYDVQVSAGDCNNDGLTYQVKLNFKVTNPGNDFFELWAGNGQYLGIYPLNQLPLAFPLFPASGDSLDEIKICINDHPDCCESVKFQAPDCSTTPCNIVNLQVARGVCTSDSTYKVTIDFDVNGTPIVDQFALFANDDFLGLYSFGDLPLTIDSFPWDGGPKDFVRVCTIDLILDPNNPQLICCKTLEFEVPDCLPVYPCGIKGLTVETDSCTSDSTFGVWINFAVNDSTAVDSFELAGNGHFFGAFSIDSLPLYIADFPWNNGIFSHIKVCTGNDPGCCKELQFLAPSCLPYGPCEVTDIFVQTGPCTSDSTYKLKVNFQATNPGDGTFTLWANGDSLGVFPLDTIPFTIDSFAWNGGDVDFIRICVNNADSVDCCREKEFHVPDCLIQNNDSCSISNVTVDPGDCVPGAAAYSLTLNFEVKNPGNGLFELWAGNGQYLGYFPLSDLPLKIPAFPCTNTGKGVLKICINDHPNCCTVIEFQQPNCCSGNDPCEITDLNVQTGDCHNNQTYEVWLNFGVQNPVGDHYGVWANGEFLGTYSLDSLPLYIPDFPWNGGVKDVVKVCLVTPNGAYGCCKTLEFNVPDCIDQPCEIYDLTVVTGDCTGDSTYTVKIDFQVANPPGDVFGVWANGEFLGTYNVNSLPLTITDFPWNGGANDVVKVCFVNANDPNSPPACCRTKEFAVPDCLDQGGPCEVYNLTVVTDDCTGDSTYQVKINFQVANPPSDSFGVWANGGFLGYFNVSDLPLLIQDFPWNGGANDVVKVCFNNSCCRTKEFPVPGCLDQGGPCHISDVEIQTGDCTGDSTYTLTVDFNVANPPSDSFGVWANNGEFLGFFPLSSLPLTIQDFPWDGGPVDHIKVCLFSPNDPPGQPFCCHNTPFQVPGCLNPGGPCEIYNLTVETGDCTGDSTYQAWINFQVDNPPGNTFGLWINGVFYDTYNLDSLPIYIADFPWNGGANDVVKVCFTNNNDPANGCCRTKEFPVPGCLNPGGDCNIHDLTVETGDCSSNTTYEVWINFQVDNPPSDQFGVWANGEFLGLFNVDSLPLYIADFPWNGGANDVVKVCFPNAAGAVTCCETKEFPVPDCLGQDPCKIYDLKVVKTPCLCGEFFAVLTFKSQNGGAEGVDIVGNGNNYGNFPYNTPQPIILGPFPGDGTTNYEFAVKDHLHPDCFDDFQLGEVDCMTPVSNPGGDAKLTLSPNPVASWLNVTAQLQSGVPVGEASVEIYHADGRLVSTRTVADGGNFLLDVSQLPAGVYRLSLLAAAGRVEGTFAKQ